LNLKISYKECVYYKDEKCSHNRFNELSEIYGVPTCLAKDRPDLICSEKGTLFDVIAEASRLKLL